MRNVGILAGALTAGMMVFSFAAFAAPVDGGPDGNVTPDVIFGSGNPNGDFTGTQANGIELGLRGKVRFNDANMPENTFNYDGDRTYTFQAGNPSPGYSFNIDNPQTANWNFEWSINSNFDGGGDFLSRFNYLLELDFDPGAGTDFGIIGGFDPVNVPLSDNAIGTNATGNGGGVQSETTHLVYSTLITGNNVAQNSWNYLFFVGLQPVLFPFDPNVAGIYTIVLSAFNGIGEQLARTSIDIVVSPVPIPGALPLFGSGLALLGFMGLKRRRARRAAA